VSKTSLDLEDFVIEPVSGAIPHGAAPVALAADQDPLGPLGKLRGSAKRLVIPEANDELNDAT
jgi:hypothetical protein